MTRPLIATQHPADKSLRANRLPHIWCPGCGLGSVLHAYADSVHESGIAIDRHVCVSGIGCTGRTAGYVNLDSYHTTHGRAIPFATGLALANPNLEVTVFSGDGDLSTIGGNHLIHAARRNTNLTVILVNNFNYGMTGGQFGATTPHGARTSTTPYGNVEEPFNLPFLMEACGAPFIARWTSLHVQQLRQCLQQAFKVDGFAFVEVISPCPIGFGAKNGYENALAEMQHFQREAVVDHNADLRKVGITMKKDDPIVVGNFVHRDRPSYLASQKQLLGVRTEAKP